MLFFFLIDQSGYCYFCSVMRSFCVLTWRGNFFLYIYAYKYIYKYILWVGARKSGILSSLEDCCIAECPYRAAMTAKWPILSTVTKKHTHLTSQKEVIFLPIIGWWYTLEILERFIRLEIFHCSLRWPGPQGFTMKRLSMTHKYIIWHCTSMAVLSTYCFLLTTRP